MMSLAFMAVLLMGIACDGTTVATETAAEQTSAALAEMATSLANQAIQLTQQAAQPPPPAQPTPMPTEPPQPLPTEPPPLTATATESPYPEGSVERASYDPAANWGPPVVYEGFEGSSGLFAAVSGAAANGFYGNGAFHITFTTRGWWTWYFGDVGLRPAFYVDVVITNGDQCVDRDSAGLMLRGEQGSDSGLLFGITCKGGYYIGVSAGPGATGSVCMFTSSAWVALSSPDCSGLPLHNMSEHIQAGPGAINRLGVLGNGTSYDLYVNGHRVGGLQDSVTPVALPPGWIGGYPALFLGAGQWDLSAASFDDFSYWRNP